MSAQTISYKKAPLLELIVEVRWPVRTITQSGGPPIIADPSSHFDIWFQGIADSLKDSHPELERLLPHEMPPLAHQAIFRFKKPGAAFPIYQFGHGIFTVNAGPPDYKSWEVFRPQVQTGIEALIRSMPEDGSPETFISVSLRYIDAFRKDLRGDLSNYSFMKDVLGVSITMPDDLLSSAKDSNQIDPTYALRMPLPEPDGAILAFQLGAGQIGKSSDTDTIMDMTYVVNNALDMEVNSLLSVLDNGHSMTHQWFRKLTGNIHIKMEPENNG